jgi:hypothetical protein
LEKTVEPEIDSWSAEMTRGWIKALKSCFPVHNREQAFFIKYVSRVGRTIGKTEEVGKA